MAKIVAVITSNDVFYYNDADVVAKGNSLLGAFRAYVNSSQARGAATIQLFTDFACTIPTWVNLANVVHFYETATLVRSPNNAKGSVLASLLRTATPAAVGMSSYNFRGVSLFLNVTAVGTTTANTGLTLRVSAVDPVSGQTFYLNVAPAAVTATGLYVYTINPVGSAGATQFTAAVLAGDFQVQVVHGNADQYTYSLGYALIA